MLLSQRRDDVVPSNDDVIKNESSCVSGGTSDPGVKYHQRQSDQDLSQKDIDHDWFRKNDLRDEKNENMKPQPSASFKNRS